MRQVTPPVSHSSEFRVGQLGRQHGQEVGGRVPPPSFVTSPGFPSTVQRNKHLPATVFPAKRGVSVVAIFLDALLEFAAGVVLDLRRQTHTHTLVSLILAARCVIHPPFFYNSRCLVLNAVMMECCGSAASCLIDPLTEASLGFLSSSLHHKSISQMPFNS